MNLKAETRTKDNAADRRPSRLGEDPNIRNSEGLTVLMIAAGAGQRATVEALLVAGADVLAIEPRMGASALHKAAQSGNIDVITLLLDYGAFIDQQSPILGNTALIDAVLYKHHDAVRSLLARGARIEVRNHWQQTALELARNDGLSAIADLIQARADADANQIRALTLVGAVKAGDKEEVKRLVAIGVDLEQRVPKVGSLDDDYTSLGIAVREGDHEIVRLLLDAGADPGRAIGLMRGTSLHEASYFGFAELIKDLTQSDPRRTLKADLAAQGPYNGLTALHDAVWHGHLEAARALIQAGASLHLETHAGQTPKDLAVLYGYQEVAAILAQAERE